MSFKPIDPKRDEYRRYLERGGIIESLTKVFVRILKERPEDPTQFLLQNLGDARLQADNIAYLQSELDEARNEIHRLTEIIRGINPDLLAVSLNANNDDNIESNIKEEIINAHDESDVPPCLPNMCEENLQPNEELTGVTSLEEGLKNAHLTDVNERETGEINSVSNEVTTNAE